MKFVGVNGIATKGERNTDLILRRLKLRGFETVDVDLKVRHFFSARWGGCPDGQLVARASEDGDIVIAHSFGCLRAFHAQKVRNYKAILCIAPAMSRKAEWDKPSAVHCWYSENDWAVRVGSWLRFKHPFGRAGITGFVQHGITNINVPGAGHGDYFKGQLIEEITEYAIKLA